MNEWSRQLQTLRGKLESMKMKKTEGVVEYITQVETVANQLSRNGETLPVSRVVENIWERGVRDWGV